MERDDETTAKELQQHLKNKGWDASLTSILRWRLQLGWTSKGTRYCQMIRDANKEKRLQWAKENVKEMNFENVIFTDETRVQKETHRRTCYFKHGRKPRYKPRPKHPFKLHVWGEISVHGRTSIFIFHGRMNAQLFVSILDQTLVPFIREVYPDGHHFQQDNDPKHCSRLASRLYEDRGINWWPTPPESPDLNPIENLWHELKEYIRRVAKPKVKEECIAGINNFWDTVIVEKCERYIGHLRKVVPEVIKCEGGATGF